jgi:eukaryotic-like serine/threonine-protein kinase
MEQTVAHFNILERLGVGSLGEVYRARDTKVGRTIALMVPPRDLSSDDRRREQFLRHARAAMSLNHPNIAMLFDVVEVDNRLYLAYEFAAGPSLRQEIGDKPVNMRRAIELAAQVADALAEGHAQGFVHGDIRPENIVVTSKGSAKILNFGMVPWTSGGAARQRAVISPGTLIGQEIEVAGYLSPEEALGRDIDARGDLFSLGTVLYEMLTGRNPFVTPAPGSTVRNVIDMTPLPVAVMDSEFPLELDTIVSRAMSKDAAARYQNAAMIASDLRKIAVALDVQSGDVVPAPLIPIEEDRRGGRWWIALLVAAGAATAWWYWR